MHDLRLCASERERERERARERERERESESEIKANLRVEICSDKSLITAGSEFIPLNEV